MKGCVDDGSVIHQNRMSFRDGQDPNRWTGPPDDRSPDEDSLQGAPFEVGLKRPLPVGGEGDVFIDERFELPPVSVPLDVDVDRSE